MTIELFAPGWTGKTTKLRLMPDGPVREISEYGVPKVTAEFTAYPLRMNVIDAEISSPTAGIAVPRTDSKTNLNLLDVATQQTVTAALTGGGQAMVYVQPAAQTRGHSSGVGYWLPQDANNKFICEPGVRHRKWYLSKRPSALTRAQIAANAGVAESAVTAAWLLDKPQYGGSPETAVHYNLRSQHNLIGPQAWGADVLTCSIHCFLEDGYDYTDGNPWASPGEDELHPILITRFGDGTKARPLIRFSSPHMGPYFVVFEDVETLREHDGWQMWYGFGVMLSHMSFGKNIMPSNNKFLTIYECDVTKAWLDAPINIDPAAKTWNTMDNRTQGVFANSTDELAIIDSMFDHSGWADGYDGTIEKPHAVGPHSHNLYIYGNCFDVTVRGNLLSRAAAQGIGKVGGGHVEANLFVDNNFQIQMHSSDGKGQFINVLDNVAYSAGYRTNIGGTGGVNWGISAVSDQTSLMGNILAHQANPDDAAEIAAKPAFWTDYGVEPSARRLVDDTQSWKYGKLAGGRNVEGLDTAVLNTTSIWRFTGSKLTPSKTWATVVEMVDHVKGLPSKGAFVDEAVRWTKSRFGTPIPQRSTPADLVFYPEPNLEGFRWDNRYNWSTKDLPGTHVADTVDLAGNFVRFTLKNADIAALKSSGGMLDVVSGKLEIGTLTDAADLTIRKAGQVWLGAANQPLTVQAFGGRLMLEGAASALDLDAGGSAQVLLGPNCTVPAGKSLIIDGQRARVGWDGTGTAALNIAGKLEFGRGVCVETSTGGSANIRFVYTHIGKEVTGSISGCKGRIGYVEKVDWSAAKYRVWLYDVTGTPAPGDVFTVSPKRDTGGVDTPIQITVGSVLNQGITPLQRFRSGAIGNGTVEPTVTATVNLASTAQIIVPAGSVSQDLTGPGVTVVNNGASLPAGVSITDGKLVYTA